MPATTRTAFDDLFHALLPALRRRAAGLSTEADAEDMVHDAYLKLGTRPQALLAHPSPYAHACATLTSVARDRHRRGRRQVLMPELRDAFLGAGDGGLSWR